MEVKDHEGKQEQAYWGGGKQKEIKKDCWLNERDQTIEGRKNDCSVLLRQHKRTNGPQRCC